MADNNISFGTTRIYYNSPVSLKNCISKLKNSGFFTEAKGFDTLARAGKKIKSGQIGVVAEKDAFALVGKNAKEDELIYNTLTENGHKRLPGSSYITDFLDITI